MVRSTFSALALCGVLAAGGLPAWAAAPPHVRIASFEDLPTPLPFPYDASADADGQVAAAKARAAASGKLLLIDLGGNWCADCRILAGVMQLPEVRQFVDAHYVVTMVDIGRLNRNLQIPAHYGVADRLEGVPSLLIVDPKSDKLINEGRLAALVDLGSSTPQAVADWLAQWVR
jgi:thiol-disulfide isomerase/thioredoxin